MAEDQLRTAIDGLRTRIQAELDAQLDAVAKNYEQTLEQARRAADAEAEQRSASKMDALRTQWTAQLQTDVAAARAEVERAMAGELTRVRVEAAQAAAEAALRARHDAEAEAEQRWAPKVEALRAEWTARLQSEVATARSEVERAMVAETMRVRVEAEQAAAESAAHSRREMEQALLLEREGLQADFEEERQRAQADLEAERHRAHALVVAERQRAERELTRARAAFDAEHVRAVEDARRSATPAVNASGLLEAIRAIDDAASLSDALAASVRGASLEAPRAALFIVNGTELQEWPVPGVPTVHAGPIRVDGREAGVLGEALRRQEAVTTDDNGGPPAPAFASLPPGRVALAVPVMLGGQPVAVLYADEGADGKAPSSWQDLVHILGRHASAYVAYLTAVRTAQAMRLMSGADVPAAEQEREPEPDEAQGARRYARLLVSEIKLYNESQVRMGRERRDLMTRLKPEIERARRLYDERVAPSIHSRDVYFQQELVQTLADGDQSLLG
jgi:GAF domain-containing protein